MMKTWVSVVFRGSGSNRNNLNEGTHGARGKLQSVSLKRLRLSESPSVLFA